MKKKIIIIAVVVIVAAAAAAFLMFREPPPEKQVISFYSPGDYFVTNIKDSARLLKTTIVLELTTDDAEEYLTENNHILRDAIVFTLREKTETELRASGAQEALRMEIVSRIEEEMNIDYIQMIYFNDYVIQ